MKLEWPLLSSTRLRKAARIMLVLLVFAGILRLDYELRGYPVPHAPPLTLRDLTRFELHQLDIGNFLELTIVAVVLLYGLTIIPYFRRLLQDQTAPHATAGLFAGLVVIQLISQIYEIWTCRTISMGVYTGFLVIAIGSLLGGWRIGLTLGAMSVFVQGTYELAAFNHYLPDGQAVGWWQFLGHFSKATDWTAFFYYQYAEPHIFVGFWAGVLGCLCADLLGARRYSPPAAMLLSAGLVFAAGYIRVVAGFPPGLALAPAQALVTALAAGAVMLIIRNLQAEAARRKGEQAELMQTQAELRALRAQINPHFLFNALNTIVYMTRKDAEAARRLLLDLSEVFQRTLRSGEFVSLRDEISYVEAYLSLEKARLKERLHVIWGGVLQPERPLETKTALLDQSIPTLTLQPLVENAVIHGIGEKEAGGVLTITVDYSRPDLVIVIEDDGPGIEPGRLAGLLNTKEDDHACIGLCNVDRRLRLTYGEAHRLTIESEVGRGTRAIVRVPVTEAGRVKGES